jgi:hypothetical protein
MPLRTTLLAPSEGFKPAGVTTLQWNRRSSRVVRGRRSRRRGSARGSRGRGECRRLGRARRAGRFRGGPSRLAQSIDLHQELGEVADVRLPGSSTRCATGRSFATNSRTSTSPKAQALPPTDRQASKNRQRSRRHAGGARRIRSHGDDAERDYVVRDLTTNVTNTVSTHPINIQRVRRRLLRRLHRSGRRLRQRVPCVQFVRRRSTRRTSPRRRGRTSGIVLLREEGPPWRAFTSGGISVRWRFSWPCHSPDR